MRYDCTVLRAGSLALLVLLGGCGLGTAAVSSAGNDETNTPARLDELRVFATRSSPAIVRFEVRDEQSDPVDVEVLFRPCGACDLERAVLSEGTYFEDREVDPDDECEPECDKTVDCGTSEQNYATTDLEGLKTSPNGRTYTRRWEFDGALGTGLTQDVELKVRIVGTQTEEVLLVDVGNDPPTIQPLGPDDLASPLSGIVLVPITVCDSSGDEVFVNVEYLNLSSPLCDENDWIVTRPAKTGDDDPTPCFPVDSSAFQDCRGDVEGEDYFWQTAWEEEVGAPCDLCDVTDARVILRITALEFLDNEGDVPLCTSIVTDSLQPFLATNDCSGSRSPGPGAPRAAAVHRRRRSSGGASVARYLPGVLWPREPFTRVRAERAPDERRTRRSPVNRASGERRSMAPRLAWVATRLGGIVLAADIDGDGRFDWMRPVNQDPRHGLPAEWIEIDGALLVGAGWAEALSEQPPVSLRWSMTPALALQPPGEARVERRLRSR